jgi:putative endonuclease
VNGAFYTGFTTDIKRRYQEHLQGVNCKYTKAFPPVKLLVCWQTQSSNQSKALKLEYAIKKAKKSTKNKLILKPYRLCDILNLNYNFTVFNLMELND